MNAASATSGSVDTAVGLDEEVHEDVEGDDRDRDERESLGRIVIVQRDDHGVRTIPVHRESPTAGNLRVSVRRRLDAELVRRGLSTSRQRALEEIGAGRVLVGGLPARSAARRVADDEPITVSGDAPRFVSRGGEKLAAALDQFDVAVTGRRALDAGASTGGFTDCLLQAGAAHVVAVDVGRGQLAWSLRTDPRVTVLERTNVRYLEPGRHRRGGGARAPPTSRSSR